ncbi:MAG: hypothetical protein NTY90_02920 [Candidatus Micrarchaeota archaeon]|nr:hypothetical protein [Candidatus Micrarchaeota archaeon]
MEKAVVVPLLLAAALFLAGCAYVPAYGQPAAATPSATPQLPQPAAPTIKPDAYFVAENIYLFGLKPVVKIDREVKLRVSIRNDSLLFEDYFNPLVNASTREITNIRQPSIIELLGITNNKTDLIEGAVSVETDLAPRNGSTSLAFIDMYTTENVFQKKNQTTELMSYVSSNKSVSLPYGKIPRQEGFAALIFFFPTSEFEPSSKAFREYYGSIRGWRYIRFLHETAGNSTLIVQVSMLFE